MIEVSVMFDFNTKEEWLMFGQKFSSHKKFEKYQVPLIRSLIKEQGSFVDAYNNCINVSMNCPIITICPQLSTKSKKILIELNNWIKENHYENNYMLFKTWGMGLEYLNMNIDQLFEWYDGIKSKKNDNN